MGSPGLNLSKSRGLKPGPISETKQRRSPLIVFGQVLSELVEIRVGKAKAVPQRLKPHCKYSGYGTAEAVPLSKTEYFNKVLRCLVPP
jgi:hypothetical protein